MLRVLAALSFYVHIDKYQERVPPVRQSVLLE